MINKYLNSYDQGVVVTPHRQPNGLDTYEVVKSANSEAVFDSCDAVLKPIELLYGPMLANPQNRNMSDVYADCLKRAGVVPRDYSGQQFEADRKASTGPFAGATLGPATVQCTIDPQFNNTQGSSGAGG
jgi:hypothetical protein